GASGRGFDRILAMPAWKARGFEVTHVDRYADHPGYLDAMAERVTAAWNRVPVERRPETVLLFSAHGLPQKFIDAGDPYVQEIEATRRGILERVQLPCRTLLAYQSRTGPVKWIGPGTEETLAELGREGVTDVLVVPLSFVSDHIETLYEVDLLFGEVAAKAGITGYRRAEALNTSPLFIDALAELVGSGRLNAPRVAIVGGGIAGLAVARGARAQSPGADGVVLERGDRVGGTIRSEVVDGYLCEAGPDGFLDNAPATLAFVDAIGLTPRLVGSRDEARRRYIYRRGRLHEVPMSPLGFAAPPLPSPLR